MPILYYSFAYYFLYGRYWLKTSYIQRKYPDDYQTEWRYFIQSLPSIYITWRRQRRSSSFFPFWILYTIWHTQKRDDNLTYLLMRMERRRRFLWYMKNKPSEMSFYFREWRDNVILNVDESLAVIQNLSVRCREKQVVSMRWNVRVIQVPVILQCKNFSLSSTF